MTLKLYLYDGDGSEIAWVTADPYDYWVADNLIEDSLLVSDYDYSDDLRERLRELEIPKERGSFDTGSVDGHEISETWTLLDDLDPEDHLKEIENRIKGVYCDSTEIVDE